MKNSKTEITRRDFVKGSLIGSGASLLSMPAPVKAMERLANKSTEDSKGIVHPWNGYSGVGDYSLANGNTESTRTAAHLIRDQKIDGLIQDEVIDTG